MEANEIALSVISLIYLGAFVVAIRNNRELKNSNEKLNEVLNRLGEASKQRMETIYKVEEENAVVLKALQKENKEKKEILEKILNKLK